MRLLIQHWSFDPVVVLLALVALIYTLGQVRQARARRRAGRSSREGWFRAAAFYGGLLVLAVAICSPLDYWSDSYLFDHMIQHILLVFAAPPLLVMGAPWLTLRRGLPAPARRGLARATQGARRHQRLVGAGRVLSHPLTALVGFNAVMVGWHYPAAFDLAARNQFVHIWVEHTSFIVLSVMLWSQILESPPLRPRWSPLGRAGIAFTTNVVMVGIAITLVLFSRELYPFYAHHTAQLFSQYSDQQIAGSALWICGEFSLAPAIYWNTHLFLREQPGAAATSAGSARDRPWRRSAARWAHAEPQALDGPLPRRR
jgi:putative membrane protein